MKRIWYKILFVILIIGGFSLDRAKHYFIYNKIQQFQEQNKDRLTIDQGSWDKDGILLSGVHIFPKEPAEMNPDDQYDVLTIQLFHDWSHPLQIQIKAAWIKGPNIQVSAVEGGISYGLNSISSKNLEIDNINLTLKRGNMQIPRANAPFTYYLSEKKLDLDVTLPSSTTGTFKNTALGAKGTLTLKPLTGHLDVHMTDSTRVIDTLVEADIIKKKHAMYYQFGANLFSSGTGESKIPLNFDKGKVYLGPVLIYEKK